MDNIEKPSDAQRAERYKRKLQDLVQKTNGLLTNLPLNNLSEKQKSLAMALADEAYLIKQQLDNEEEFRRRFNTL